MPSMFPDETLLEVFEFAKIFPGSGPHVTFVTTLSQVCRRWRNVCLGEAGLWTHVHIMDVHLDWVTRLARLFQKSEDRTLDIAMHLVDEANLRGNPRGLRKMVSLVVGNMARIRAFTITAPMSTLSLFANRMCLNAAPRLEALTVRLHCPESPAANASSRYSYMSSPFYFEAAPSSVLPPFFSTAPLRHLAVEGVSIVFPQDIMPGLLSAEFDNVEEGVIHTNFHDVSDDLPTSQIRTLTVRNSYVSYFHDVRTFPELTSVKISHYGPSSAYRRHASIARVLHRATAPALQELELCHLDQNCCEEFLSCLRSREGPKYPGLLSLKLSSFAITLDDDFIDTLDRAFPILTHIVLNDADPVLLIQLLSQSCEILANLRSLQIDVDSALEDGTVQRLISLRPNLRFSCLSSKPHAMLVPPDSMIGN